MTVIVRQEIPFRLERSTLFVPATNWGMIEKAAAAATDAVCIDLEDSVTPDQKVASRANVVRAFMDLHFGDRLKIFRINGLDSPYAYRDLIEVVEVAGDHIDLVMVPKVDSADHVIFVDTLLTQIVMGCGHGKRIGIEAQIETASGFLFIREIAQASLRLEALVFGPGDYAASMQMPSSGVGELDEWDHTNPGHRWHAVMHAIVAAARARGLRCVDGPFAAYKDVAAFERSCRIARGMGFDGKQCIHPAQLSSANAAFTPAAEEAAKAEKVLEAFERAQGEGLGAVSLDGKMIDAASVRIAKVVAAKYRLKRL
jgi:citrate lyase beta subunit